MNIRRRPIIRTLQITSHCSIEKRFEKKCKKMSEKSKKCQKKSRKDKISEKQKIRKKKKSAKQKKVSKTKKQEKQNIRKTKNFLFIIRLVALWKVYSTIFNGISIRYVLEQRSHSLGESKSGKGDGEVGQNNDPPQGGTAGQSRDSRMASLYRSSMLSI